MLQAIPTYVMSCFRIQKLFVMTLKEVVRISSGEKRMVKAGFFGYLGTTFVSRSVRGDGVSQDENVYKALLAK